MDLNASPLEVKQKADELYARQEFAAAAEEYRKLVQAQPGATGPMKALGLSLVLSKQADEGVSILRTAAAMQPADAELRYAYGYGLGSLGHWDESIAELDAALSLQPNHIPARQGLVYCLLTSGQALAQVDPILGELRLDRAFKLDQRNAHVAHALLDFMVQANQKGKVINMIKGLDDSLKAQSPLKELLTKLQSDPDYSIHMKQVSVAQQAAGPSATPVAPGPSLKQVPCPNCRQPIMDYAAICPHCNTRLRATGTFAGRDTGPKYEWQEIAYTVMSIIWTLLAVIDVVTSLPAAQKGGFSDFNTAPFAVACFQTLIGLGLVLRQEWIVFIAKIFCYIRLGLSSIFLMLFLFSGVYLLAGFALLQLAAAGFMVYLINYVVGD